MVQQEIVLKHLEEAERLVREAQKAAETCLQDNLTPAERIEANARSQAVAGHVQDIQQRRTANAARVKEATQEKEAAYIAAHGAAVTARQAREDVHQQKEHHIIEEYRAQEHTFYAAQQNLQEQRLMKEQRLTQAQDTAEEKLFSTSKREALKHFADWKSSIGFEKMTAAQQIAWLKLYQQEEMVSISSYTFQPFINPQTSQQEDTEVARRMMLKRLNETCSQQIAAAEKRLAAEEKRHAEEQRLMHQGRHVSPRVTALPASTYPRISVELILQCGLDFINSPDISRLDQANTPAMLLLFWDFAAVLSALAPETGDNEYTKSSDKPLFRMQQLSSEPARFKQSLSRLEQQIHRSTTEGITHSTGSSTSDPIFNLDNPALKIANRALQCLQDKSKVSGLSFYNRTPGVMVKSKSALSLQDKDFAALATEAEKIERQAHRIDPNALPVNVRVKMRTRAASLDKNEANLQRTMAI